MVLTGEETGKLDVMLKNTADSFEYEADMAVSRLVSLVEPVMILGLGAVIGAVLLGSWFRFGGCMGTWDRNGRSRCRKEIFRRRAGRLRRMKGSAMLEAMAVILVFLVMASVLFASGRALNRQTVRTLEKNVARDGALTAVRLLAQDIMEGNRPGEEMEPEKTELEVILEDGLGTFTVPVTVWAGEEGRNLVLYGMCAYGGQTEAVSLLLEKTEGSGGGVTPSSAAAPVWRPVRYAPAEPLEE